MRISTGGRIASIASRPGSGFRTAGFTLIEVVAALAIAALVCLAAASAGTAALSQRRSAEAWSGVRLELRGGAAREWAGSVGPDGERSGPSSSNDWVSVGDWTPRAGSGDRWDWRRLVACPPGEPDRGTTLAIPAAGRKPAGAGSPEFDAGAAED